MPRIRTIKPEFWSDEKLAPLDPQTRLVFLGLISMADDEGRLVDNLKSIDAFIFPLSDESSRDARDILARESRIIRYTIVEGSSNGAQLIQIVNWSRHQKIDRPKPSLYPGPRRSLDEASTKPRDSLDEASRLPRRSLDEASTIEGDKEGDQERDLSQRARKTFPPGDERESFPLREGLPPPGAGASPTDIGAYYSIRGSFLDCWVGITSRHPCKASLDRAAQEAKKRLKTQRDWMTADQNHAAYLATGEWTGAARELHWFFVNGTWRIPPDKPAPAKRGPPNTPQHGTGMIL